VARARATRSPARKSNRQKAGHYPTLDLPGGDPRRRSHLGGPPISPIGTVGSIGLTLQIPIFQGGLTQSRVREAVALRDRAEQDLENTSAPWRRPCAPGFLVVSSGISQVRALEQALVSTQSQLDSTILGATSACAPAWTC
jgi:outer membrane protein